MQLDHVALAVRSVEAAAAKLCPLLGYERKTTVVTNQRQRVNVMFLAKAGSVDIKLIEPSDEGSPLWATIRSGGGLHHLAFKVPDVEMATTDLVQRGARLLSPPAPGEAFDEHLIAFCYAGFGLNVELIDTEARRNLIDPADAAS